MATISIRKKLLQGTREPIFVYAECGTQKYHKRLSAFSNAPIELEVPAGDYRLYAKSMMLPPMSNTDSITLGENDRVSYEVAIGYRFLITFMVILLFIVGMPFVQNFFPTFWLFYLLAGIVLIFLYALYVFTIGRKKMYVLKRLENNLKIQ